MRKFLHLFGVHNYKLDHTAGVNRYWECLICGKRKFDSVDFGYTEPDYKWLMSTNGKYGLPKPEDFYAKLTNN